MAKEREGSESTSTSTSCKSCKSDRYPLRNPDISNCHVCESQINLKGRGKDKIRTLHSHWRIVIICNSCFNNLQSAKTCSYCFTKIFDELSSVCCRFCNRRIHPDCLSMYGKLNSCCKDIDSFTCVDCWIPKSVKKVVVNLSRVSEDNKDDDKSVCLEDDAAEDVKSNAEVKLVNAVKARKTALEKSVVARKVTEMAANVMDIAAVAADEESKLDGVSSVLDDAELALRLHRAINSSPRTFRKLKSVKLDKSVYPKIFGRSENSVSTKSDLENHITSEMEVGTDNSIPENVDKAALESSLQSSSIDDGSYNDLGTLEHNNKKNSWEPLRNCNKNGDAGTPINCETVLDASQVQMSDFRVCILALSTKDQQASFLSKAISRSYYKKTYSRSRCRQNREGLVPCIENCRGTQSPSVHDAEISALEKNSSRGSDMFIRKYSRRCQGRSKYIKKYSRRHKRPRHNLDRTSEWPPESSCLKAEISGTPIPLLWMSNKEELTSNGSSVPSQASTSAGS
ncbi:hypothetical protein ACHQM5_016867 [Ranunculus cassubicifolius]